MGYIWANKSGIRTLPLIGSLTPSGGPLMRTLEGHSNFVNEVYVIIDGNCAVSASSDSMLKVWDLKTGKEVSAFAGDSTSLCIVFSQTVYYRPGGTKWKSTFLQFEKGNYEEK